MKMSIKQMLALRISGQNESRNETKLTVEQIDLRCADGLKNYEKLRQLFPWLDEENESYL
jgi:hypothetical protein